MSWISAGLDTEVEQEDKRGSAYSGKQVSRFWMKPGTDTILVFLNSSEEIQPVWEHQFKIGNDWRNWATCLDQDRGPNDPVTCDACLYAQANKGKFGRKLVYYASVIDCSKWTDKDGNEHKMTRRLLGAKGEAKEMLARRNYERVEAGDSLKYSMFKVFRSKIAKSCATGSEMNFVKMIEPSAIPEDFREPFDLQEVLAPDPAMMKGFLSAIGADVPNAGGGGGSPEPPSDDIPF